MGQAASYGRGQADMVPDTVVLDARVGRDETPDEAEWIRMSLQVPGQLAPQAEKDRTVAGTRDFVSILLYLLLAGLYRPL
jgi:hypothetical protein